MERLTERTHDEIDSVWVKEHDYVSAAHRLADYEDTGLTPEEIMDGKLLTGWIPVSEKLPESDGTYIVFAPTYSGGSSSGLDCICGIMFCRFKHGKWSIEHGYYNRPNCVTHWMPMPEPPEEAE